MNQISNQVFKFVALGGLDEDGKNCYILEIDDDIFVIEAGLKYPDSYSPGVDYHIPDFQYLLNNKDRVRAIIVTHGHDDIFGSLPFLLEQIGAPCYLTKTTYTLCKSDYDGQFDFNKYKFHFIQPSDEIVISNRRFSLFSTTHSASDSFGFVLRTELGNIVYTGDYITDYTSIKHHIFDFAKVASIANERNTLLLLSESSGADKIGICAPNHRLTPHIKTLVEEQSQRLFIAVYSQNFYSIQEVIDLAIENNKKIVIVNERFAKALPEINQTDTLVFPRGTLIQANEAIRYSSRDIIVLVLGTGEELFDLITSLATGSYTDKTLYIKPDDRFVLACPPVPGTEKIATDALDAVYQTGSEVLNLTRKQISSMHAHEEDIKMMLALFKPKYFLPIKGEYRHLMQNAKIALSTGLGFNYSNTIILDNGMQITIDSSKTLLPKINKVESGDLVVSGKVIAKNDGAILRERNRLADEGIVCLTVAVSSKQQRIISQPEIQMRGFIYLGDQRSVYQEIYQMFLDTIHELMAKRMMTTSDAEKKLVDKLGKYLTKQIKKNPYLEVNIINIDEKDIV